MTDLYLGLGSNLGNSVKHLDNALSLIKENIGSISKTSAIYKTEPWGRNDQPDFLNMCIQVKTSLTPEDVLQKIEMIEKKLSRQKVEKWGPRTIDIDILFYNNIIFDTEKLKIPHPFLHERQFVLQPLADIAPGFVHPVLKRTIAELLAECPDKSNIRFSM